MIGVENAKVFAAAAKKVPKDPTINALIEQMSMGSTSDWTGAGSSNGSKIQRFNTFFKNKFLRVDLTTANKTKKKGNLVMTFVVKNLTRKPLFLMMREAKRPGDTGVSLDCHDGRLVGPSAVVGISYKSPGNGNEKENYSVIEVGEELVVSMKFFFRRGIESDLVSLIMGMERLDEKGPSFFTVGIPNLKI